ncbi:MAG: T9SS type A sorting domain-containing protein, partial [Rhodothermales bacterium]|nr:T9SS type A sorting domain-containing protein [Rhodothermales bacterium]
PMLFQLNRQENANDQVATVSAGIFGTENITSISFSINDVEQDGIAFLDTVNSVFRYDLPSPVAAGSKFKISATDAMGRTVSDSVGVVPPPVVDEPLPPGIRDGITYSDADPAEVTLSLLAPRKSFVYVIGEFNNWELDPDYLMKRDSINADSVRWWLTLPPVTPGQEYAFQYLVDGEIRVADPYSYKILDEGNDPFIGDVYPNLKPYPTATSQIVSVFQTNQSPYNWEATDYVRPQQHELVIYEMLVRDWVEDHSFASIIDSLDYFENLGVNALQLMPVSEFDGNVSWGYNPAFHLALDKYYGPPDKLKELVDEAHKRNMAVILDVVYNHATGQSPLVRLYNTSATGSPGSAPSPDNPWVNVTAKHPFNVFNDINHESTFTKTWLDRANEYWLTEFNVDGFRFDLSKGFTQFDSGGDVGLWSAYDASRIAILERMADRIWDVDSTAYITMEHFGSEQEEIELALYKTDQGFPGMLFWENVNNDFSEGTMGYPSNFADAYFGNKNHPGPSIISFMESHDEQWIMYKNLAFGACSNAPLGGSTCDTDPGAYSTREFNVAFDRMKMAGAFLFTIPGPKMMWQFGELGYGYGPDGRECLRPGDGSLGDCPAGTPDRIDPKPIRWEYNSDPLRLKLKNAWSAILRLRKEYEVFRRADTGVVMDTGNPGKVMHLDSPFGMDAVIVGNFAVTPMQVDPNFLRTGVWYDFFSGDSIDVQDPNALLDLLPGEFHIYTSEKTFTPEPGLITVSNEDQPTASDRSFGIHSVHPNPVRAVLSYMLDVDTDEAVNVSLYDLVGRKLMAIEKGVGRPGSSVYSLDTSNLPAGVYFLRAESGVMFDSKSFVVVR